MNLYNPDDFATALMWPLNNEYAKGSAPPFYPPADIWQYRYVITIQNGTAVYNRVEFNDDGEVVSSTPLTLVNVQGGLGIDAYEVIAFIAQANTNPIGTMSVPWFDVNTNIQTVGLSTGAGERPNHSFEFHHDAATTWNFYKEIKQQTGFEATF